MPHDPYPAESCEFLRVIRGRLAVYRRGLSNVVVSVVESPLDHDTKVAICEAIRKAEEALPSAYDLTPQPEWLGGPPDTNAHTTRPPPITKRG